MFYRLIFSLCLLPLTLLAAPLQLKENLKRSSQGDYLVTQQGQNYNLWLVKENRGDTILIEEIQVPKKRLSLSGGRWQTWLNEGARGQTAWVLYSLDTNSGAIQTLYSINDQCYLDPRKTNLFLATLLNLPFYEISAKGRKKKCFQPSDARLAERPFWHPPLYVEGQLIPQAPFVQYYTRWPKDGSDFSLRYINIFLPYETETTYASHFPYWLEMDGMGPNDAIRAVDSGKGLTSPTASLTSTP